MSVSSVSGSSVFALYQRMDKKPVDIVKDELNGFARLEFERGFIDREGELIGRSC